MTPPTIRALVTGPVLAVFALAAVAGCASRPETAGPPQSAVNACLQDKPAALRPYYEKVVREGARNEVLNQTRAALAAMELGEYALAAESLDDALLRIKAVYADNEQAARARSYWYEEGSKDFKGEPYERAMACYYRALLYLRAGEFERAHAWAEEGIFQDRMAEEQEYAADFAMLFFISGWASKCQGDDDRARTRFAQVQALHPDFHLPADDHNTLIVVETGYAPRKLADGPGHFILVYRRGKNFSEESVHVTVAERVHPAYCLDNIFWQASTRGGRLMDDILQEQGQFRMDHTAKGVKISDVSEKLRWVAPGPAQIALSVAEIRAIQHLHVAMKTKPQADTRYWDNLPDALHVFTCRCDTPGESVAASFFATDGDELPSLRTTTAMTIADGKHGFAWMRSRSALTLDTTKGAPHA